MTLMTRWLLTPLAALALAGCGSRGEALTPEQEKEYRTLSAKSQELTQERAKLAQELSASFKKNGDLEKQKGLAVKGAAACGASAQGGGFDLAPFKKRPNRKATHRRSGDMSRASCDAYSLKVSE